jgi:hypothetical protein
VSSELQRQPIAFCGEGDFGTERKSEGIGHSKRLPNKMNILSLLGQGAGGRGRRNRFDAVKLDNLFFGVL